MHLVLPLDVVDGVSQPGHNWCVGLALTPKKAGSRAWRKNTSPTGVSLLR
jgi:hypothetical protein